MRSQSRKHTEVFEFGDLKMEICTDTAFTNPRDHVAMRLTIKEESQNLNTFQVERILGSLLRALYFSVAGEGMEISGLQSLHPAIAADYAQQVSADLLKDIANTAFRRVMDDEGYPAALISIQYQLEADTPKLVIPGKEATPKVKAARPEFLSIQIDKVPQVDSK